MSRRNNQPGTLRTLRPMIGPAVAYQPRMSSNVSQLRIGVIMWKTREARENVTLLLLVCRRPVDRRHRNAVQPQVYPELCPVMDEMVQEHLPVGQKARPFKEDVALE